MQFAMQLGQNADDREFCPGLDPISPSIPPPMASVPQAHALLTSRLAELQQALAAPNGFTRPDEIHDPVTVAALSLTGPFLVQWTCAEKVEFYAARNALVAELIRKTDGRLSGVNLLFADALPHTFEGVQATALQTANLLNIFKLEVGEARGVGLRPQTLAIGALLFMGLAGLGAVLYYRSTRQSKGLGSADGKPWLKGRWRDLFDTKPPNLNDEDCQSFWRKCSRGDYEWGPDCDTWWGRCVKNYDAFEDKLYESEREW